MAEHRIVFVTCSSLDEARGIAQGLVDDRLAACVNIVPGIASIYRWQGKVTEDNEVLMIIKTVRNRLERLTNRVRELHSYETPEVIAVEIIKGDREYLDWVSSACSAGTES